jgi:hypothetical protein
LDRFKSIFTSRTIIANVVTAVASILVIWGFNLSPEQIESIVTLIIVVGSLASSLFRVVATKQLVTRIFNNPDPEVSTIQADSVERKPEPVSSRHTTY